MSRMNIHLPIEAELNRELNRELQEPHPHEERSGQVEEILDYQDYIDRELLRIRKEGSSQANKSKLEELKSRG